MMDLLTQLGDSAVNQVPSSSLVTAGTVLDDLYELVEEIARGSESAVWQARRIDREESVAIKLITRPDSLQRQRFEAEICLTARLRGLYVGCILDSGFDRPTQTQYLVMEALEGESLAHRLRRLRILPPREVLVLVKHIGRALSKAHALGVVHDDVTPENIYLTANYNEPWFKLLDFGRAKDEERLDPRRDLWSLAVIACECLTGHRPFDVRRARALELLRWGRVAPRVPSSFGGVPPGFDEWFARATVKNGKELFASVDELVEALKPICGIDMHQPLPSIVCETPRRLVEQQSEMRRHPPDARGLKLWQLGVCFCLGALLGAFAFAQLRSYWGTLSADFLPAAGPPALPSAPSAREL